MYSFLGTKVKSGQEFVDLLLIEAIRRVNNGVSKTLTARKTSELPPKNSRHLTDTRTRVSTLLEYSLAYEMNHILLEEGNGLSVSAVLWNVFPDLIVRNKDRENLFGLEVKALHTAAEEKSANLATPLQLIRRSQDFVVIVNWGWQTGMQNGVSTTYPHIHLGGVFDAWLLAKIRDFGWLYKHGGRKKGIDLASPIISGSGDTFKAEEGNMGKLMRIDLPADMPNTVPDFSSMRDESERYNSFKKKILSLGLRETFLDLCMIEGANPPSVNVSDSYPTRCQELGSAVLGEGVDLRLIAGPRPEQWLRNGATTPSNALLLWLSQKLEWRLFRNEGGRWNVLAFGNKPDSDLDEIRAHLRPSGQL